MPQPNDAETDGDLHDIRNHPKRFSTIPLRPHIGSPDHSMMEIDNVAAIPSGTVSFENA